MNNYSILFVDDESTIRTIVSYDLKRKGYNVVLAESGEQALEIFEEKIKNKAAFDLVITDLLMEGIDGVEVLKRVKKINPHTQVVILTGHGDLNSAINAVKLDADDYILKPCSPEELEFTIIQCFKKLELQRKVKLYEELLPVCCVCKSIRDDTGVDKGEGNWMKMSEYLHHKAKLDITHTYCDGCYEDVKKELIDNKKEI